MAHTTFSQYRPVTERYHRRRIRITPPGQGLLYPLGVPGPGADDDDADDEAARLPRLAPVLEARRSAVSRAGDRAAGRGQQPPRTERAEVGIPRSIPALLRTVIVAVNARGMCAAHAARVAELPVKEVDAIEQMCACALCTRQRAH